jgi:ABC-2 type transport system permease protein
VRAEVEKEKYDGYLYIPAGFNIMGKDSMILRSNKSLGLMTREKIEKRIDEALEEKRFARLDISRQKLDSLQQSSEIRYSRLDGGDEGDSKAGISYGVGLLGFLITLYCLFMGPQML